VKKFLILLLSFYILTLFQTSFVIHFKIFREEFFSWVLDLVFIAVILINCFSPRQEWSGIALAFIGGFFLDIFSENFIGFHILILVAIAFFIKFILRKHVRIPAIGRA
jgi:rod shape-determining protein MreD